jgi:prophage DNA circulation protein
LYEDVSQSVTKQTSGYNFPDASGTYVQDLGHSGRRYPLRVIFWGADHDQEARAFESALLERGAGKLEHPLYGVIDVVPYGDIKTRDRLKTAANQSVLEVTFWATIGLLYPTSQTDPAAEVQAAVEEYTEAAAEEFGAAADLDSAVEQASFTSTYESLLDSAEAGLQAIAEVQDNVARQFNAIVSSINRGIDVLVAQPLTLARQTISMILAPARAAASIKARLSAYANLASALISGDNAVVSPGGYDARPSNQFHTANLFASSYVIGAVVSAINNQFETKPEALAAAEEILAQRDAVVAWQEANYGSLGETDTGAAYQKLQAATTLTAGYLVEISFSLKQERVITLDRDRTVIDLAAEVYGEVDDDVIDFLLASNALVGDEILNLPQGKDIVYYV